MSFHFLANTMVKIITIYYNGGEGGYATGKSSNHCCFKAPHLRISYNREIAMLPS